jgi:hypothetical protein
MLVLGVVARDGPPVALLRDEGFLVRVDVLVVVRVLEAPVLPGLAADAWFDVFIEPGTRAGLGGDFTPGLLDAPAACGFEGSCAGAEPRVGRVVVLGFSETRLGLWAKELARSLATSRAVGLELVLWAAGFAPVEAAVVGADLLAALRADPTEEGFFLITTDESDFCEGVSELVALVSVAVGSSVCFGGVFRDRVSVSMRAGSSLAA